MSPGAFVAAVGSDNPEKQELDAALVAASVVVAFDSTGTALQDVAAAAVAYERAVDAGVASTFDLAG